MILKFGKHRGESISEVPSEYLEWLLEQNKITIEGIEEELERRISAESAKLPIVQQIIQAGYRVLAKQHHPDHGGDIEKMKEVNSAVEYLRRAAREK